MSQKMRKNIFILGIITAIIVGIVIYTINWAFFDIQRIEGQEYILDVNSPNKKYTITAYLNNGGATTDYSVLCTLKNNDNGKSKNIYWQYNCDKANIEWISNETVKINGKKLNVKNEIYDYRKK